MDSLHRVHTKKNPRIRTDESGIKLDKDMMANEQTEKSLSFIILSSMQEVLPSVLHFLIEFITYNVYIYCIRFKYQVMT